MRLRESIKSALIVLLVCSAVFLAIRTGVFNEFFSSTSALFTLSQASDAPHSGEQTLGEAAKPLLIVLTGENGLHCAVKYDSIRLDEAYASLSGALGEALGSAGDAQAATAAQFRRALTSAGVFFDFQADIPLSSLAAWLGMDMLRPNPTCARRVALTASESGGVELWYLDGDGAVFRCATASVFQTIADVTSQHAPNNQYFVFELGNDYAGLDEYLVLGDSPIVCAKAAFAPSGSDSGTLNRVLEAFGYPAYYSSTYTETNGVSVYVRNGSILKISDSGEVFYKLTESAQGEILADSLGDGSLIETARAIVAAAASPGSASICFDSLTKEEGFSTVEFSYVLNGIRIAGSAASVRISDSGAVIWAKLRLGSYSLTEDTVTLLPELQAAAIVRSDFNKNELRLVYVDGDDGLEPIWAAE